LGLIAIDLDGTLINNQHDISQESIKAIQVAQNDGYEVVIATGRSHFDAQKILKGVGLSLYTIGANGATAHSPSGTNILSIEMPRDKVEAIVKWLDDAHLYYELFCDDGIYTPKEARNILYQEIEDARYTATEAEINFMSFHLEKQLGQLGFVFMEQNQDVFQGRHKIYNILAYSFDKHKRQHGWKTFKERKDLTLVTSSPFNFELGHPDASKGNAIGYLAKVLNKTLSVSMAVGDSGNDTSMFGAVSHSYAMANADDEVKAKAKYVTASNDEEGVAQAIYDFLNRIKIK